MNTYRVRWHYAMSIRDEHGVAVDPRRSGGERDDVLAESSEDAIAEVTDALRQAYWTQPWDDSLLEISAVETFAGLTRDQLMHGLQAMNARDKAI
jgi:hypothetical protein